MKQLRRAITGIIEEIKTPVPFHSRQKLIVIRGRGSGCWATVHCIQPPSNSSTTGRVQIQVAELGAGGTESFRKWEVHNVSLHRTRCQHRRFVNAYNRAHLTQSVLNAVCARRGKYEAASYHQPIIAARYIEPATKKPGPVEPTISQ